MTPDGRWRVYAYDGLVARDSASLDIFWLKDDSLADSDNLPPPEMIAQEIVDDLEAALEQFRLIAGDLGGEGAPIRRISDAYLRRGLFPLIARRSVKAGLDMEWRVQRSTLPVEHTCTAARALRPRND